MCDVRSSYTWYHRNYDFYGSGFFPGNHHYLNPEFQYYHPHLVQLLLPRPARANCQTAINHSSSKRMHPDGRSQCTHAWPQGPLPPTARTSAARLSLAEWLESNNFQLHNEPGLPTHHPRNGTTPSTIDLCLSHCDFTNSIISLATNNETTSDHSEITVTLAFPSALAPTAVRPNWGKANLKTFEEHIRSTGIDLLNLQGKEDTLRAVTNVTTMLHDAINAAVPSGHSRKPKAPWWNHSLMLANQSVKRADRWARLNHSSVNREDSQKKHQH